ncbi:hypothetical protein EJ08DRAFT_337931 [Tothia fuscella]|uniref:Uncharacterized protein n=1 Tax=Tothia fuscella TaxID=1048955 RepID=A0A9P4U3A9_9PEZI|nr:hypothetical protein EJ08DRAFT_337931 [Tothia fuscella]
MTNRKSGYDLKKAIHRLLVQRHQNEKWFQRRRLNSEDKNGDDRNLSSSSLIDINFPVSNTPSYSDFSSSLLSSTTPSTSDLITRTAITAQARRNHHNRLPSPPPSLSRAELDNDILEYLISELETSNNGYLTADHVRLIRMARIALDDLPARAGTESVLGNDMGHEIMQRRTLLVLQMMRRMACEGEFAHMGV